jgi:uncharacterized protein
VRAGIRETPASVAAGELDSAGMNAPRGADVSIAAIAVVLDCDGALYWPDEGLLAIADLHLEKGSSFAARGVLLPPYDTATTLGRLARVVARYAPRAVIALGDSFHDRNGPARMATGDRAALVALQRGRDWIWIAGNHDPDAAKGIGGSFGAVLAVGALVFRHEPSGVDGEIAGHLHPVARVSGHGRSVRRRCFASDGTRLIMPAFGAFTGGLNVRDRGFADIFGTFAFTAHMLGNGRIYPFPAEQCLPD